MLEITKMKMTPALSAEHQRKWDQSQWELENFADSVRWQLQKVSAEKEKISADTLRLLGGVSLWQ